MFTVNIPLSGHIFALVTGNIIFFSWYFDGHQINISKITCWLILKNGPILVVMTKEILCCIDFMEISSLFWATKMWLLCNSAVMLQLNNIISNKIISFSNYPLGEIVMSPATKSETTPHTESWYSKVKKTTYVCHSLLGYIHSQLTQVSCSRFYLFIR